MLHYGIVRFISEFMLFNRINTNVIYRFNFYKISLLITFNYKEFTELKTTHLNIDSHLCSRNKIEFRHSWLAKQSMEESNRILTNDMKAIGHEVKSSNKASLKVNT